MNLEEHASLYEDVLTQLVLEPTIKAYDYKGEACVALLRLYSLESAIATRLIRLNRQVRRIPMDSDSLIKQFQQVNGIQFHQGQYSAIRSATVNGVTVITGGPGTGKTTIVKCIAEIFSANGLRVEMCAPTDVPPKDCRQVPVTMPRQYTDCSDWNSVTEKPVSSSIRTIRCPATW